MVTTKRWAQRNPDKLAAYRKRWREAHPVEAYRSRRNRQLKANYGISLQEYEGLAAKQNNCCAICRRAASACKHGTLHVDHDHITGIVRGLLCGQCNTLIGLAGDSPELLQLVAKYLLALDTGRAPEDKGRNGSPAGAGAEGANLPGEAEGIANPSGAPSPRSNQF